MEDFEAGGFGHVKTDHIHNLRDLGGMPAAGGRHVAGQRLLRSSALSRIDAKDADRLLDENLRTVVDLRTKSERESEPDHLSALPGVAHYDVPVLDSAGLGISFDAPLGEMLKDIAAYEHDARDMVVAMYGTMVESETGQAAFRKFFELAAAQEEGALLWHCTEGKDRTGMCAMLLERALGVDDALAKADYLASNLYCEPNFEKVLDKLGHLHIAPESAKMAHTLFTVQEAYWDAARAKMDELAGGIDGYLKDFLGVDDAMVEHLQALYLE
jgi:protein-tyrosine phosphatase